MKGPSSASQGDDEETAALVPPLPAPCPNDDNGAQSSEHDSTGSSMAVDQTQKGQPSPTAKPWCSKVFPTKGIGLVMGVLVILALLIAGTTSSGWIHLSSSVIPVIAAS